MSVAALRNPDRLAAQLNGEKNWTNIQKYYTPQLQQYYVDNYIQLGVPFLRMINDYPAKDRRLNSLITRHGKFRELVVHLRFRAESSFADSEGKPRSKLFVRKAHFSFCPDPSNDTWWNKLNSDIARYAGYPGAEVTLTCGRCILSASPDDLGIIYTARFREIQAFVAAGETAKSYAAIDSTTSLAAADAIADTEASLAEDAAAAMKRTASAYATSAARRITADQQSNEKKSPTTASSTAGVSDEKQRRMALREQMKKNGGILPASSATTSPAAPLKIANDIAPVSSAPAKRSPAAAPRTAAAASRAVAVKEIICESIAAELAANVASRASRSKKSAQKPTLAQSHRLVHSAVEKALSSGTVASKLGTTTASSTAGNGKAAAAQFWSRARVADVPALKRHISEHIGDAIETANNRFMSKVTASNLRGDVSAQSEHAKRSYNKMLIESSIMERLSNWVDEVFYTGCDSADTNDHGPTVLSPWLEPCRRDCRWDNYRFCCWRPCDDAQSLAYLPPVQAQALLGSRYRVQVRPVLAGMPPANDASQQQGSKQIVTVITNGKHHHHGKHHKHAQLSDSSDESEPNQYVHHKGSCSSSSSSSSSSEDEGKRVKAVKTATVSAAAATPSPPRPAVEELAFSWANATRFEHLLKMGLSRDSLAARLSVIVPSDEAFSRQSYEQLLAMINDKKDEESRLDFCRRFLNRYVCVRVEESCTEKMVVLQSVDRSRVYRLDLASRVVLTKATGKTRPFACTCKDPAYPNMSLYLAPILHTDV